MRRAALTDFDRDVLTVLLSSGGWNATTPSRLALVAKRYGVSPGGLARVIAGLSAAARSGRLQGALDEVRRSGSSRTPGRSHGRASGGGSRGESFRSSARDGTMSIAFPGGASVPTKFGSNGDAASVPGAGDFASLPLGRRDSVLVAVVMSLLGISVVLFTVLVVMLWRYWDERAQATALKPPAARDGADHAIDHATQRDGGASASSAMTSAPTRNGAGSASASLDLNLPAGAPPSATATGSPPVPVVPVSYPRVPGFKATLASLELDQALAVARGSAFALEAIANEAPDDRASIAAWSEAQNAIGRAWPRLDAVTRRVLLDRSMALLRRVDDSATAELLIAPLRAHLVAAPQSPGAMWRGAWAAGVLGSLLSEPGLSPEVVAVIAQQRMAPAEGAGDAFDRFTAAWLDQRLPEIADRLLTGAPQDDFDRFEAWIEAQRQVRADTEVQEVWLRAIELLLHRALRFDLPGTAPDLVGRFASMVEWRTSTPGAAAVARRFSRWMHDSTIPAQRLWAFGSILRQGRFAPWFEAPMLIGDRATMEDRNAALSRIMAAIGPTTDETVVMPRIPREFAQRWEALASRALASDDGRREVAPGISVASLRGAGPASTPSNRALAGAEVLYRLAELSASGGLLLAGRSGESAQRLSEIEAAWNKPLLAGLGPGGRSLPVPDEPSGDGLLAKRLDEVRTAQERIEIVRRKRAEAALDLGPQDAARLVREAYQGEPSALRLTAQGVIVDSFASGRRVAQELIDQFVLTGGADAALARFVERLTGERLPPHPNPAFRAKAMAALLRHRLRLSEHAWHGVDALLERTAAQESARLDAEGGASEPFRDSTDPSEAIDAIGDLLRARAGARIAMQPFPASLDTLDRRDEARRALADGAAQRLVASLWRALELDAYLAAADRPSLVPALKDLLAKAQAEATAASSAIDQACAVERARVTLLGARIAAESGGTP